jgi:anti-sigma factor RsiW
MEDQHNCRHLLGELSDYVDGELEGELCAELERHLLDCENCRIVVDTLRKTVYIVHANTEPGEVPADVRERLFKCLDLNEYLKP